MLPFGEIKVFFQIVYCKLCDSSSSSNISLGTVPLAKGRRPQKKNGKKSDIEQKGGRGLSQNHSFLLPKKNDICVRKEGVKSSCHGLFSE